MRENSIYNIYMIELLLAIPGHHAPGSSGAPQQQQCLPPRHRRAAPPHRADASSSSQLHARSRARRTYVRSLHRQTSQTYLAYNWNIWFYQDVYLPIFINYYNVHCQSDIVGFIAPLVQILYLVKNITYSVWVSDSSSSTTTALPHHTRPRHDDRTLCHGTPVPHTCYYGSPHQTRIDHQRTGEYALGVLMSKYYYLYALKEGPQTRMCRFIDIEILWNKRCVPAWGW